MDGFKEALEKAGFGGVMDQLKKAQETQAKGEPRVSFPKDMYSTLKSNILAYQAHENGVEIFLKGGETKILYKYNWSEVNEIIDG